MFDEEIFEAICNALEIPLEERSLLRQMAEVDAQNRRQRQQLTQEVWEHIQRAMNEEAQHLTERLRALTGEDVHVELEEVDDA